MLTMSAHSIEAASLSHSFQTSARVKVERLPARREFKNLFELIRPVHYVQGPN